MRNKFAFGDIQSQTCCDWKSQSLLFFFRRQWKRNCARKKNLQMFSRNPCCARDSEMNSNFIRYHACRARHSAHFREIADRPHVLERGESWRETWASQNPCMKSAACQLHDQNFVICVSEKQNAICESMDEIGILPTPRPKCVICRVQKPECQNFNVTSHRSVCSHSNLTVDVS